MGRSQHDVPGAMLAERAEVALDEPLLDCAAAAALLNVRVSWVRDAARLGQLPCLRVGRHMRFTRTMLEDWLAGQFAERSTPGYTYSRPAGGPGRRASSGAAGDLENGGGAPGEPGRAPKEPRYRRQRITAISAAGGFSCDGSPAYPSLPSASPSHVSNASAPSRPSFSVRIVCPPGPRTISSLGRVGTSRRRVRRRREGARGS